MALPGRFESCQTPSYLRYRKFITVKTGGGGRGRGKGERSNEGIWLAGSQRPLRRSVGPAGRAPSWGVGDREWKMALSPQGRCGLFLKPQPKLGITGSPMKRMLENPQASPTDQPPLAQIPPAARRGQHMLLHSMRAGPPKAEGRHQGIWGRIYEISSSKVAIANPYWCLWCARNCLRGFTAFIHVINMTRLQERTLLDSPYYRGGG